MSFARLDAGVYYLTERVEPIAIPKPGWVTCRWPDGKEWHHPAHQLHRAEPFSGDLLSSD